MSRGWPESVFYPTDEVRYLLENVIPEDGGNQMLSQRWLSPREWCEHIRANVSGIPLPSPRELGQPDGLAYRQFLNSVRQWAEDFAGLERERDPLLAETFTVVRNHLVDAIEQIDASLRANQTE